MSDESAEGASVADPLGLFGATPQSWRASAVPAAPSSALVGGSASAAPQQSAAVATPLLASPASQDFYSTLNPHSRGVRNNNPGNLEAGPFTASMPGYKGSDGRFAVFATPEQGIAALKHNLAAYAAKGIATPLAIASTWAPGSESGNDPGVYGGAIAKELGVGPGDRVNLADPAAQEKIARAIMRVENGTGPGGSNAVRSAGASASGAGSAGSAGLTPGSWEPPSAAPSANPAELFASQAKLAILRSMFPQHSITPVEYDPYKLMPQTGGAGAIDVNKGVG